MKFDLKITQKTNDDDRDFFDVSFETYNGKVQGRFEKSELRNIIEIIDNAIHH